MKRPLVARQRQRRLCVEPVDVDRCDATHEQWRCFDVGDHPGVHWAAECPTHIRWLVSDTPTPDRTTEIGVT